LLKGIITGENLGALMILYSEIGGHVLTPFLDTYLWTRIWELMKCRSAGERVVTGYQRSCRWVMMPMTKQQNVAKSRDDGYSAPMTDINGCRCR